LKISIKTKKNQKYIHFSISYLENTVTNFIPSGMVENLHFSRKSIKCTFFENFRKFRNDEIRNHFLYISYHYKMKIFEKICFLCFLLKRPKKQKLPKIYIHFSIIYLENTVTNFIPSEMVENLHFFSKKHKIYFF
jgi:hypothetical protein